MSKKAWNISYISAMVGPCTAMTKDGDMAWGDGDYSVRLLDMDNDGEKLLLHIDPSVLVDELKTYQLIGYAIYHDLPYSVTQWDEFMSDDERDAHPSSEVMQ